MTTHHRKLSLEETIQAAHQQGEIDAIIHKTLAMSDEEIARELEADGVDVGELDARLAARGEELFAIENHEAKLSDSRRSLSGAQGEPPVSDVAVEAAPVKERSVQKPPRVGRRRSALRTAGIFGAGAATTGLVVAALAGAGVVTTAGTAPIETRTGSAPPLSRAADLRKEAFEACGRGHWQECIARFDEARTLDPAGDAAADVVDARKRAATMLEHR